MVSGLSGKTGTSGVTPSQCLGPQPDRRGDRLGPWPFALATPNVYRRFPRSSFMITDPHGRTMWVVALVVYM